MIMDPAAIENDSTVHTTVAIIGAGPAGLTLATQLAQSGVRVTLIETGDHGASRRDERHLRGRCVGVPFPLTTARSCGFAGTSLLWQASTGLRTRPLDDVDFESSPARPGTSWPIQRSAIDPFYRRANEELDLDECYDATTWFEGGPQTQLAGDNGDGLAYFQFADEDHFTRTWQQIADSRHIELFLGSSVAGIEVSRPSGAVDHLEVRSSSGNRFRVSATSYVLAGGTIENSRLLLDSSGLTGAGVGNEHDQVGRFFMDHPSIDSGVIVGTGTTPIDVSAFLHQRSPEGMRYQPMWWAGNAAIREHRLLNAAFWVNRLDAAYLSDGVDAARALRQGARLTPKFPDGWANARRALAGGRDLVSFAASRLGRRSGSRQQVLLRILAEQVPDPSSRITLDTRRDAFGRRRVVLDWRIGDTDLRMIRRHQDLLATTLEQRGVGTVVDRLDVDGPLPLIMSNHHHIGGTRMHDDPKLGVVDADGRVHTAKNLLVAGSSVFPTGGYLNPTLTIIALAIRMADLIKHDLTTTNLRPQARSASPERQNEQVPSLTDDL